LFTLRKQPNLVASEAYSRFRRRLLTIMFAMAALAIAIVAWQLLYSAKEREQAVRLQTQHYARAMSAHILYSLQLADVSLLGFANAIKALPNRDSSEAIASILSAGRSNFHDTFWLAYIDKDGKGVASSNATPVSGYDFSDRDYFIAHKESDKGLFVGAPAVGRVTKNRVFFLSRRVENADGKFMGVLAAPLDAARYAEVFENSRLSSDVAITLVHTNGHIIARAPDFERTFNRDVSNTEIFQRLTQRDSGTFQALSTMDGRSRIFSYSRLPNLPLIVNAGSSDVGIALLSRRHFIIAGVGLGLFLLLVIAGSVLALKTFATLEERETRYRKLYVNSVETEEKLMLSEQRLRLIADNLPIVIAYIDRTEHYTFTNRKFTKLFGLPYPSDPGKSVEDVLGPELYLRTKPNLERAYAGETVYYERKTWRNNIERCDGVTYVPDKDEEGHVIGLFVMAEDVTDRKKSEESMQLAALMYQNSSEGMMVTDAEGMILSVNPAFSRISGFSADEVVGHQAYELTSGQQDINFFSRMRQHISDTGHWEGEIWHQHKNGEHYLVWLRFNTVFDKDHKALRHVALFADITKKKATEEAIWKQANFDALTGLPNRRMFNDRLRQEMKKAGRDLLPMALIFIDLDGFKGVNDSLGHDYGDLLLKQVAERLLQSVRNTDTVARLGGDEFTVILSELKDNADVVRIVQEILGNMSLPFHLRAEVVEISASIGITLYPEDGSDAETLIKNADQAMYAAKQQGRNRFNYFAPFMQEASQMRIQLANELREGLQRGELRLVYQPIRNLHNGRIEMAEALVRWQHPQRGLLIPAQFIEVAEHCGLISSLGEWVFEEAASQIKRLQAAAGDPFQICVNKSAWQFRHESVSVSHWIQLLDKFALAPHSIVIEITENLLLEANRDVARRLKSLRDAHMQLSLDDFGAGYSSLAVLKHFKLDYLKLDPGFTSNPHLCEAITTMAHRLDIQVVAEHIETEDQLAILTAAGCDFAQGYLLKSPISLLELERLLITQ
jgi:diguanylate cyclase (GGDEF)-like protein/PAS domain S-box-containing protein